MIDSIEVNGYRLLDQFEADFGDLTVVIGANAAGKSTVMDCLRFISSSVQLPLRDVVRLAGGLSSILTAFSKNDRVSWKLVFRKPLNHPYWKNAPLDDDQAYVYEVTIGKDSYGEPVPDYEVLRKEHPYAGHEEPLKYLEATLRRSLVFSRTEHRLVSFDEAVGDKTVELFGKREHPKESGDGIVEPPQVAEQQQSLRLAQMKFLNEYPILSWTRALLSTSAFYPGFDVGRNSKLRTQPAEIAPTTVLYPDGENLGTVFHEILTRAAYRASAVEIREFLRVAYPIFDDIFAETTFGTPPKVLLRVREKGLKRPMEVWELSDGMVRFLCLSAALLNPMPPAFIAIDEPEVGLHPRLLPVVADMIKTAGERTQVLITTHSPDLLNCFDIDNLAVMAREENKVTWSRPGDRQTLRTMLASVVGDSLGDHHRSGELEAL